MSIQPITTDVQPIIPQNNINICFVGGVSTGKSTILNAIFCEELTQCKIKRTTMVPTVYIENENNPFQITDAADVFQTISQKNTELIRKTENGEETAISDYNEMVFNVGKLDINILQNIYVNVYDIPGLNDARTKNVYYHYLEQNFFKFNLIVFIVDIHSGLNTSDEIDIVRFITNHTKYQFEKNNKKIYTLVVVNKADDMQLADTDNPTAELMLTGELNEMFEQVEKTITSEFAQKDIKEHLIGIVPLCGIDSYLYRMVKKHGNRFKLSPEQILKIGINETGKKFSTLKPSVQEKKVYDILQDVDFISTMIKLSGFSRLEEILAEFFRNGEMGKRLSIDNLLFELNTIGSVSQEITGCPNISQANTELFEKHATVYQHISKIDANTSTQYITTFVDDVFKSLFVRIHQEYTDYRSFIEDYDRFVSNCLGRYFAEHVDTTHYPVVIMDSVRLMIYTQLQHSPIVYISEFIQMIHCLRDIGALNCFTAKQSIANLLGRNKTYKQAIDYDEEYNMTDLVDVIKLLQQTGASVLYLLRFLLIYKYKGCSDNHNLLMCKRMLYANHNEIHIQFYLTQLLNGHNASEFVFIYDTQHVLEELESSDEILLDTFYLDCVRTNK
jgi:GTP-binding protein EngB required for normal cell division